MRLIGVLNGKGGVGKSTLTTALAVRATHDFKRVAIIDLDGQLSGERWSAIRQETLKDPDVGPRFVSGFVRASDALPTLFHDKWDVVFFDGAPGSVVVTEDAVSTCDFVLIPMRSGEFNIHACQETISACKEFGTPYMLVLNEVQRRNDRQAVETHNILVALGEPLCPTWVMHRIAYRIATDDGLTGPELRGANKDKEAVAEIDALYTELMARIEAARVVEAAQ